MVLYKWCTVYRAICVWCSHSRSHFALHYSYSKRSRFFFWDQVLHRKFRPFNRRRTPGDSGAKERNYGSWASTNKNALGQESNSLRSEQLIILLRLLPRTLLPWRKGWLGRCRRKTDKTIEYKFAGLVFKSLKMLASARLQFITNEFNTKGPWTYISKVCPNVVHLPSCSYL